MQKINDLFEEGKYEEVLELTKDSTKPQEIFVRISTYIEMGKREEAFATLLKNREALFKTRPLMTMRADFELRFALNQFDEAYDDLEYFSNLPYVSQEVEEELRAAPKRIRAEEKAYLLQGADQTKDLNTLLKSNDPYAVLGALSQIGNKGMKGYEEEIKNILSGTMHHDVKGFALEVLVALGYPKQVCFIDGGKARMVRPSELVSPFEEQNYKDIRKHLGYLRDSSLSETSIHILDEIALASYPDFPFKEGVPPFEMDAIIMLGQEYLGQEVDKVYISDHANKEKERFKEILEKHPPLSL